MDDTTIRESISDLLMKILSDDKLRSTLSKIENDPATKMAAAKLKKATDEMTPAIESHVMKYPNSRLSKLLKSRGYI